MDPQIRIRGTPISHDDAGSLIATLYADGTPEAEHLAARLIRCLDTEVALIELDDDEADTLLAVLEDPPPGLVELRGALPRDHRDRQ